MRRYTRGANMRGMLRIAGDKCNSFLSWKSSRIFSPFMEQLRENLIFRSSRPRNISNVSIEDPFNVKIEKWSQTLRNWRNSQGVTTHRVKDFGEMIDVGVSDVCADDPISPFPLESLQDILLRELPQSFARCHPEQQVVLVVARDRCAVLSFLRKGAEVKRECRATIVSPAISSSKRLCPKTSNN